MDYCFGFYCNLWDLSGEKLPRNVSIFIALPDPDFLEIIAPCK
jgi:hypothetical protein